MSIKVVSLEIELYFLAKQKKFSSNNCFENTLKEYLSNYQTNLAVLDEQERSFLISYFTSNQPKKIIIKELGITEDKYYSDYRRIIKKLERKLY